MTYVVRNTYNPEYDVIRNWSAWIGHTNKDLYSLVDSCVPDVTSISRAICNRVGAEWETFQDGGYNLSDLWNYCSIEDRDEFETIIKENYDELDLDIRFHEFAQEYMLVHHDGLSCYTLEAETEEEAVKEVQDKLKNNIMAFPWCGFGDTTEGSVKFVMSICETLHIFECKEDY
jgi:hypothetical protein